MLDTWIVDWTRDERLPYYTRANAGEVLPDPASPLGWSLVFEEGLLPGWYRGFVEFGIYGAEEFNTPPKIPMVGIFGGYFYLNLSHMRLLGLRLGADLDKFDADLLGSHPDTPPYEPHPDDVNPELSAKAAATIGEILGSTSYPLIDADRERTARLAADRPDLSTLSDAELVARARSFVPELDNGFARHDYSSLASTIGPTILAGLCGSIGRPDLQLELISGLGDVDSASPSRGLWELSREANASAEITALFDEGPGGRPGGDHRPRHRGDPRVRRVVRRVHARVRVPRAQRVGHPRAVVGGRPGAAAEARQRHPQGVRRRLARGPARAAGRSARGCRGDAADRARRQRRGARDPRHGAGLDVAVGPGPRAHQGHLRRRGQRGAHDHPRARSPWRRAGAVRQAGGRHDAARRGARRLRASTRRPSATPSPSASPPTRSCTSSTRRSSSRPIRPRCRSGHDAPSAGCRR